MRNYMSNYEKTFPMQSDQATPGVAAGQVASPDDRPARPIPPKLYRIGELVGYSGLSRQTIHNYTMIGLLRESGWSAGGHRLYGEEVFSRLDWIVRMKRQKKSIPEIAELLENSA